MNTIRKELHEVIEAMAGVPVAVLGDLVADVYVYASPYRLSREAPVVIARHEEERLVPGGAANVLANLAALGAHPRACGVVGEDDVGVRLLAELEARGVVTDAVQRAGETATLTRYMVGSANTRKQQVLRIDRFGDESSRAFELTDALSDVRGWIVSDYGYGAVGEEACTRLRALREQGGVPVVGDSRSRLELLRGFTLVKPNQAEAEAALGRSIRDARDAGEGAAALLSQLGTRGVLVTLGNLGMCLREAGAPADVYLPAVGSREAVDVSGAGDTVCAVALLALAAGATLPAAVALANRGAAVVVMHEGTTPLTAAELHEAVDRGADEGDEPDLVHLAVDRKGAVDREGAVWEAVR